MNHGAILTFHDVGASGAAHEFHDFGVKWGTSGDDGSDASAETALNRPKRHVIPKRRGSRDAFAHLAVLPLNRPIQNHLMEGVGKGKRRLRMVVSNF